MISDLDVSTLPVTLPRRIDDVLGSETNFRCAVEDDDPEFQKIWNEIGLEDNSRKDGLEMDLRGLLLSQEPTTDSMVWEAESVTAIPVFDDGDVFHPMTALARAADLKDSVVNANKDEKTPSTHLAVDTIFNLDKYVNILPKPSHPAPKSILKQTAPRKLQSRRPVLTEREDKRLRNRFHAHQSRMRRKSMTSDLHLRLSTLREENNRLKAMIGKDKAEAALERSRIVSHDRFVNALKQPKNRRLRKRTVNFLKKLQKNLPEREGLTPALSLEKGDEAA
ncbi:bZIP basic region leucine zipper domain containing protein [Nitzschia inconspicua]|uniref:BZIP basic region leucine zipper domain containing protein n=1 Tax=Nitzschia inconspicua TaxID=303405 RepID=A0A9K3M0H1_9STRA|nr:bZIP basic region leucine zipper domain containing protein [Nitzschia inconspicua]